MVVETGTFLNFRDIYADDIRTVAFVVSETGVEAFVGGDHEDDLFDGATVDSLSR